MNGKEIAAPVFAVPGAAGETKMWHGRATSASHAYYATSPSNRQDVFQDCRERISAAECAEFYGFHPNRAGFITCPFHYVDKSGIESAGIHGGQRVFKTVFLH